MLKLLTHNYFFLSRQEVWFFNDENIDQYSYNVYSACENKPADQVEYLTFYHTSYIDLSKAKDVLHNNICETFRYDIRKGETEKFHFKPIQYPSTNDCRQLINSFNFFAKTKNIQLISKRRIYALHLLNRLYITKIFYQDSEVATHVYLFDDTKILLLHSFHHFSTIDDRLRGYANKLLHWQDILLFKEKGLLTYDWGGIDLEQFPGISNFKLNFGGNIQQQYSYIRTSPAIHFLSSIYKRMNGQ